MADSGVVGCTTVEERIEQFVDGALGRSQAAVVGAHIADCEECTAALEMARSIREELRSLPQMDASPELLHAIKSVAARREPWWIRWFEGAPAPMRLAGVAATLVLVVALAVVLRPVSDDGREGMPPPSTQRVSTEVSNGGLGGQSQDPQPSEEEIAQAASEARYALAYFQRVAGKAGLAVRHEVFERNLMQPATQGLTRGLSRLRFEEDRPARDVNAGA